MDCICQFRIIVSYCDRTCVFHFCSAGFIRHSYFEAHASCLRRFRLDRPCQGAGICIVFCSLCTVFYILCSRRNLICNRYSCRCRSSCFVCSVIHPVNHVCQLITDTDHSIIKVVSFCILNIFCVAADYVRKLCLFRIRSVRICYTLNTQCSDRIVIRNFHSYSCRMSIVRHVLFFIFRNCLGNPVFVCSDCIIFDLSKRLCCRIFSCSNYISAIFRHRSVFFRFQCKCKCICIIPVTSC